MVRRDLDLIRKILLHVESGDTEREIKGYSVDSFRYHGRLAIEAGLVHGSVSQEIGVMVPQVVLYDLTWAGHDFLDAARNEGAWIKVRKKIDSVGGSVAFDVVKELLVQTLKSNLGLP